MILESLESCPIILALLLKEMKAEKEASLGLVGSRGHLKMPPDKKRKDKKP